MNKHDGSIFKSKTCVDFCNKFDSHCLEAITSVLTEFWCHADPIIATDKMKEFIAEAPSIFGELWHIMCVLRGVKPNQAREKDRTEGKMNEVFFELMSLTCIANRKKLLYWAMIQNISNFARGVGRTAECAFGFFGHTLSPTSRD